VARYAPEGILYVVKRFSEPHDEGVRGYTAVEFHRLTLQHCGLPVLEVS
jgi:hypothetical protein